MTSEKRKIVVIGGGPAGAFFTLAVLKKAAQKNIQFDVTIVDGKVFGKSGPKGCNLCAGVLSASLIERLKDIGINLHEAIIQSNLRGYILHVHGQVIVLEKPPQESDIFTVFRGNGPLDYNGTDNISFDDLLLKSCHVAGAKIVPATVTGIGQTDGGYVINTVKDGDIEADLLVVACGVNSKLLEKLSNLEFGYEPPKCYRAVQAEIYAISREFPDFVHSFYRSHGKIRFGAFTPKKDMMTVTLVGRTDLNLDDLQQFLNGKAIRENLEFTSSLPLICHCHPNLNVKSAKNFVTDNLVVIGDASCTRYYKNGIESAYITATMAAEACMKGMDALTLRKYYMHPAKSSIPEDNYYGRILFRMFDMIFRLKITSKVLNNLLNVRDENWAAREMLTIMWSTYTGGQSYKTIFKQMTGLKLQSRLISTTLLFFLRQVRFSIKKN